MSIFDTIIGVFAPHYCLACGAEGSLICSDCDRMLIAPPARCYRCRKLSPKWRTCSGCRSSSGLRRVYVSAVYDGTPKEIVGRLKFYGVRAAASDVARRLAGYLPTENAYLVPVPTATSRVRQRGYDQAKLLARELSKITRLPYLDCLARSGQAHQVGASRTKRLRQLSRAYRVTRPRIIAGEQIILVDDVVTTGATLEAAAKVLRVAGARHVDAIVYAQP